MSLSVPVLVHAQLPDLATAARGLEGDGRALAQLAGQRPELAWIGTAADQSLGRLDELSTALSELAQAVGNCAAVLRAAVLGWRPAVDGLHRAVAHAATAALEVGADGSVPYGSGTVPGTLGGAAAAMNPVVVEKQRVAIAAQALAQAALRAADEVDRDAADMLFRATANLTQARPAFSVAAPRGPGFWPAIAAIAAAAAPSRVAINDIWMPQTIPTHASARDVAAWWAVLPVAAQQAVVAAHPEAVGGLDGMPAWIRHQANLVVMQGELAAWPDTVRRLTDRSRDTGESSASRLKQLFEAIERRRLVASVQRELAGHPERLLLTLDFAEAGYAAVSVGDPDTARHVAVVVPGLNCDARGDLDNIVTDASTLHTTARQAAPGESVAAVAWIGYRTPNFASVLFSARARAGGARLAAFTGGISASREMEIIGRGPSRDDGVHITVVGHSYGSHTTAEAIERRAPIDDVIFVGSPGTDDERARNMRIGAGHIYVGEAGDDLYADIGTVTRTDPSSRGFGGIPLHVGGAMIDGHWWRRSNGHSEYFSPGTESIRRIAGVVVGAPVPRWHSLLIMSDGRPGHPR